MTRTFSTSAFVTGTRFRRVKSRISSVLLTFIPRLVKNAFRVAVCEVSSEWTTLSLTSLSTLGRVSLIFFHVDFAFWLSSNIKS